MKARKLFSELCAHAVELACHPQFHRHPLKTLLRLGMWPLHCCLGRPVSVRFRDPDFVLLLPATFRSGGGTAAFILRERYEPEYLLLSRMLKPGMVFIDVGANAGAFALAAAMLVGEQGRVVAVEPGPTCHQLLLESVQRNGLANIAVLNVALSNREGTAQLFHHYGKDNSFGLGSAEEPTVSFITVRTATLDSVFLELQLPRLDLLKLDVEGAQQLVLEGGWSLIERHRPLLIIENNQGAARRLQLDPATPFAQLESIGYTFATAFHGHRIVPTGSPATTRSVLCFPYPLAD